MILNVSSSVLAANILNPRRNILIVDDSEDDSILLEHAFQISSIRHERRYLLDGGQAINYLQRKPPYNDPDRYPVPDLMILDLKMPGADGFDVLEWLRGQRDLSFPVVVMSGSNHPDDFVRAISLGACDYCIKVCSLRELAQILQTICDRWLPSDVKPRQVDAA